MKNHGEPLAGLAGQHVKAKSWGLQAWPVCWPSLQSVAPHQVLLAATLSQQVSLPLMALIL